MASYACPVLLHSLHISQPHLPITQSTTTGAMGNNKFVVFGGGGHVGQAFARQAVAMGAEVTSVVRDDSQ